MSRAAKGRVIALIATLTAWFASSGSPALAEERLSHDAGSTTTIGKPDQNGPTGLVPRLLGDDRMEVLKARLLKQLPREKPIRLVAVERDAEAFFFASQIRTFLEDSGFIVLGITSIKSTPAHEGVEVEELPDGTAEIYVGADWNP